MTLTLGIDLGSTTTKVALVEIGDAVRVVRVGRVRTPDTAPGLHDALAELIRSCLADAPGPIAAVGIASMAETGVPLDGDGVALTPFQRWDRASGRHHLDALLARRPRLTHETGLPATPKPALLTLMRLREDEPDVFARMVRWQGVADHVAAALTGAHATDHTLASRTMFRRRGGTDWDADLRDEAGVTDGVLPVILPVGEPAGRTDARAGEFGLAPGIPVFVAGHDHAVGAWASGVRAPGDLADSLGTAEAVLAVTAHAEDDAVVDGFSIGRTVDDRHDTVMGGSPACGALLADWPGGIVDALAAEDPERWRTSPVTVLPYPRGRQCPAPDPDAVQRTFGEPLVAGDVERGVLQSLVLHSRWMRTAITGRTAEPAASVVLLGSLTERIPAWGPLAAAASVVPFARCASPEPVAAGAGLLAAVRAGLAPDDLALDRSPLVPAAARGLDRAYERLVDAALRPD